MNDKEGEAPLWEKVVEMLKSQECSVTTVESLTGGMLAHMLVKVSGVSKVFPGGFVTYSNELKHRMVGVRSKTLKQFGAVSRETVCEMAAGAARVAKTDFALATTGVAGPSMDEGKPVGLVYIACYDKRRKQMFVREFQLKGNRDQIREKTVERSLRLLKQCLDRRLDQNKENIVNNITDDSDASVAL